MKKICMYLLILLLMTACNDTNKKEEEKSEYLAWKSELVEQEKFTNKEDLTCDITISVNRVNEETVSYTTTIENPKENMNNIKMMVVHNYFTEEVFPTTGVFDKAKNLSIDNEDNITLVGYIDTLKDIKKLDLELKIWIEYTDEEGNKKDIYYKTTK